jgi:outer membrane protein assembly factor BamB
MVNVMTHLALTILLSIAAASVSAQWPQWRGPNRDGVVPAVSVPAVWPVKPVLRWKQTVGEGYSTPIVAGNRIFVHSRRDPEEIVSAFDLETGKPFWSARYPAPFSKNQYAIQMAKGPNSTPVFHDGRLFTLGATAILSSFDAATGELKWRKDWSKEIDTSKLFTGTAMSPIVDSGLLIVHVGDDGEGAFRAFDPVTGIEKWSLPGHGPGYASPIVQVVSGTRQLITMTDKAVVGLEVATGKLLWQIPFPDEWNENIVTPIVAGDVLVVSGTRKGTYGYRIEKSEGAEASWTATELWHNTDLPMYMSSPVADGPFIYGLSSKRKGQVFCVDAKTGTARWATEGRAAAQAAVLSAGPNLVLLTTDGELIVATRSPERFEELRRYTLAQTPTWAQPVLLGRQILIRDADSIAVWSL